MKVSIIRLSVGEPCPRCGKRMKKTGLYWYCRHCRTNHIPRKRSR